MRPGQDFKERGKLAVLFLRGKPHLLYLKHTQKHADIALEECDAVQDYHLPALR